jgi:hypothetical protein
MYNGGEYLIGLTGNKNAESDKRQLVQDRSPRAPCGDADCLFCNTKYM